MSVKLFSIYSHSNTLRGIIIKPKNAVYPCKTAIVSHGFASNLTITSPYAKTLVKAGYVTVLFDFCMSGSGLSSGNSKGMSVLTEKENLNDLLYYVKRLPYVDEKNIVLAGCSQGGLVSALSAAENRDDVKALLLYYPAFCIPDDARRGHMITAKFAPDHVPETFHAATVKLGRKYVEDAASLDPYKEILPFEKPVLIVHGIEDTLVNIDYSRRAQKEYKNCTLVEVHGDHGFIKKGFKASSRATLKFLKENNL